jgi:hypothetical protein
MFKDASMQDIAAIGGPALEELKLYYCVGLQDSAFQNIILRSPNLRSLVLYNCDDLTDDCIPL